MGASVPHSRTALERIFPVNKYRVRSGKGPLCRAVLLVALATGTLHAHAGSFWLHTGGLSTHASSNVRNETNSGSGLEYRFDSEWAVGFGRYETAVLLSVLTLVILRGLGLVERKMGSTDTDAS